MHDCKSDRPKGRLDLGNIPLQAALGVLRLYRCLVSPFLGACCRFYPSCSEYAEQALNRKGLVRGTVLTVKRLLKCQPFHPGGVDVIETGA